MSQVNQAPSLIPGAEARIRYYAFANSAEQADNLTTDVTQLLRTAVAERGTASLIVSGGRSPVVFFEKLSQADLPWHQIFVSLADERLVDTAAGESNERLVRTHLLINAASVAQFVPLRSAIADRATGLIDRNQALKKLARPFDVVVLGMGVDGHTASMFPGAKGLEQALNAEAEPALVGLTLAVDGQERVSLNRAALLDARCICLLIQGAAKREVLERARAGTPATELPIATIVQQRQTQVHVYWTA